jgi:hypothetical protein
MYGIESGRLGPGLVVVRGAGRYGGFMYGAEGSCGGAEMGTWWAWDHQITEGWGILLA